LTVLAVFRPGQQVTVEKGGIWHVRFKVLKSFAVMYWLEPLGPYRIWYVNEEGDITLMEATLEQLEQKGLIKLGAAEAAEDTP